MIALFFCGQRRGQSVLLGWRRIKLQAIREWECKPLLSCKWVVCVIELHIP